MKGLHHVGITVKDLDTSIRFYHDVLGLGFGQGAAATNILIVISLVFAALYLRASRRAVTT